MLGMTVLKLDLSGQVTWKYTGRLLRRTAHSLVLEAFFDREDMPFLDLVLKKGDRFVETYHDDRCYNVFEIHDCDSLQFKGWYCNLSRPARLTPDTVAWVDLALDLWVWPDGRTAILDQDEFDALPLERAEREQVKSTLLEFGRHFRNRRPPPRAEAIRRIGLVVDPQHLHERITELPGHPGGNGTQTAQDE